MAGTGLGFGCQGFFVGRQGPITGGGVVHKGPGVGKLVNFGHPTPDVRALGIKFASLLVGIKDPEIRRGIVPATGGPLPAPYIAGLLKIRGSEIQQRYSELMMLAAGPYSLPFIFEAMDAGWQGNFPGQEVSNAPLAANYFNMRKTTIYGGSNEVQRNIVAQTVLG